MAFPLVITFLTMAIFVMTICSKSCSQFPSWKSSFLPWVILGPGGAELLNSDELEEETSFDTDDMERKSKEITVTWKPMPKPHFQPGIP
ncbi:hypothetical protein F5Y02DRAFT_48813 [Annulohypoxylon stygium]|nr:hypothetical protein F5Y02DRAFT_48813 [Annulohypoxylon stygium]